MSHATPPATPTPAPAFDVTADLPAGVTEVVPILDFGSQYVQLIARRVREAGVYSMLLGPQVTIEQLQKLNPTGIILSGGPASVNDADAPPARPPAL